MEKPERRMTFGEWVRSQRAERGFTQQQLADHVGVDRTYITKIEKGTIGLPQYELRNKIGAWLGFNDDDLADFGFVQFQESQTELLRMDPAFAAAISAIAHKQIGPEEVAYDEEAIKPVVELIAAIGAIPADRREDAVRRARACLLRPDPDDPLAPVVDELARVQLSPRLRRRLAISVAGTIAEMRAWDREDREGPG